MRILVISDTHVPRSAVDLPQAVYKEIENVDLIVHAGDFVEKDVLEKLQTMRPVRAVIGNMDSEALHKILPQKDVFEVEGCTIGLIHGYGAPANIVETVASEFKNVDAIIFGHSHSPLVMVKDNVLFFNPGSPTDKVFAKTNTYGIIEVTNKKLSGHIVEIK